MRRRVRGLEFGRKKERDDRGTYSKKIGENYRNYDRNCYFQNPDYNFLKKRLEKHGLSYPQGKNWALFSKEETDRCSINGTRVI